MMTIIDLGLTDYENAYKIQKDFVAQRKALGQDVLLMAEHRSIFTIGRTGRRENLLADEEYLEKRGIRVLTVDRGGDITFHGPGQLVLYPIIDLKAKGRDLHKYLRDLEEVVIRFLSKYSVAAGRIEGKTGVWVGTEKIASIGIGSSNWVTYHGVGININTDLRFFSMINPCGMKGTSTTSLKAILNEEVDIEEAKEKIVSEFKNVFGRSGRDSDVNRQGVPAWLKKRLVQNEASFETRRILSDSKINTVCESSLCPNLNECFSRKTATFLILGNRCTRACAFCAVEKKDALPVDPFEPQALAAAARRMGLKYVVITSVTRDDLSDGGAGQFVKTIKAIRAISDKIKIEVLVPDFKSDVLAIEKILELRPDVFGHNIETIKRLYPIVRRGADYEGSLRLLRAAKRIARAQFTKSGIMVGLGEGEEEVIETIEDISMTGCDILTIGQYLRPTPTNMPVRRFVTPEEFGHYKKAAEALGFKYVASGPFVRSSYLAEELYKNLEEKCHEGCYAAAVS